MTHDPILEFRFEGPECRPLHDYTELQRAVMPLVGIADETVTPLATCFGISTSAPLVVTAWHVIQGFVREHHSALLDGSASIAAIWEANERVDGASLDLGGPQPVCEIMYQDSSDLALLLLHQVTSSPDCRNLGY